MDNSLQSPRYGVILVTAASEAEAEAIAEALVQAKLAACVSITPIRSIYTWKNQVYREQEWQLLIKADLSGFENLAAKIHEIHSYEVPEIIALPIVHGSQPYLDWLTSQTRQA